MGTIRLTKPQLDYMATKLAEHFVTILEEHAGRRGVPTRETSRVSEASPKTPLPVEAPSTKKLTKRGNFTKGERAAILKALQAGEELDVVAARYPSVSIGTIRAFKANLTRRR